MKKTLLTLAVAAIGISGASAQIAYKTINSAEMVNGYMNPFELNGASAGWSSGWGVADLNAVFPTSTSVIFSPNTINDPNSYWYNPVGQVGASGNKLMQANLYAQVDGGLAGQTVQFDGIVSSFSLATNIVGTPYFFKAFIRDFAPDYSSMNEVVYNLTGTGAFQLSLAAINDPARHVQWGLQMYGPNIWPADTAQLAAAGSATVDAIPEPSTYAMLALGAAGLGAHMIRRRRR